LRGQNSQRREARRPPHRAAHEVRTCHQPQDRQGPRPHDTALAAGAGGSGDRVDTRRRRTMTKAIATLAFLFMVVAGPCGASGAPTDDVAAATRSWIEGMNSRD